ncbi:hypothetical protein GGR50DRAFT_697860 [Xylaria sp. CBS 124048]|nr:hypothetical protein GGR50DRAFT_697860 [Xylaria sp. CBS 124048]
MSSGYQTQGAVQSPQGQYTATNTNAIPLICLICPKNSQFSDLSHLLTHISSKGHLHNVFQYHLVRDVDNKARSKLAEFESWYELNNISALLRARKSAREQRDSQQRQSQLTLGHGAGNAVAPQQGSRGGRSNRRGRGNSRSENRNRSRMDALNDDDIMKFEPEDNERALQRPEYRSANNGTYMWNAGSIYSNVPNHYPSNSGGQFQDYLEDEDDSSKYEASELYGSPYPTEDTPDTVEDDTGALILKGAVYPGMGGFDSATEQDRRMRNQKKGPAVLQKLETSSEGVTTVEMVLDMNLEYQRSRDVYDEPSIDGSDDDDEDDDVDQHQTKRKANQEKSSSASTKRRANGRSRQQLRSTGRARATRSSARGGRGASRSSITQPGSTGRITRSSTNRQEQLPLHSHGVHPDVGTFHDRAGADQIDDGEGFRSHVLSSIGRNATLVRNAPHANLRRQQHEHLQGLALRPGNPNVAFVSPTPGFKKSPPHYSGKENNHLLIKSPASSFNPYLHPSNDSMEASSYNPLCPQPGDGFGYHLYSSYDEDSKTSTTPGFNPINNNSTYDSAHATGVGNNSYHHNQSGGDDYPL